MLAGLEGLGIEHKIDDGLVRGLDYYTRTVFEVTAAGLGVSTAVSIGGDAIIGSTYAELMPLFEADEQTQAIVIYTEPGGRMEADLARHVTQTNSRLPIVASHSGYGDVGQYTISGAIAEPSTINTPRRPCPSGRAPMYPSVL